MLYINIFQDYSENTNGDRGSHNNNNNEDYKNKCDDDCNDNASNIDNENVIDAIFVSGVSRSGPLEMSGYLHATKEILPRATHPGTSDLATDKLFL